MNDKNIKKQPSAQALDNESTKSVSGGTRLPVNIRPLDQIKDLAALALGNSDYDPPISLDLNSSSAEKKTPQKK